MVISSRDLEMVFYFAIPIEKSNISINTNIIGLKNMPEIYRSSIKRFGKLLNRSETFQEVLHDYYEKRHKKKQDQRKDKLKELDNKVSKARMKKLLKIKKNEYKLKKKEWKEKEEEIEEFLDDLSHYSVSFFTTCQMITKKITHGFKINKCMAVYENGFVSIHYIISNDTLLTTITKGKPKYGKKLKKVIGQIRDSMEEILDIAHEEEIEYEDEDFF